MSKLQGRPILNLQATLVLDEKEIRLLNHFCSFGSNLTAVLRERLTTGFDDEVANEFFSTTRDVTDRLISRMDKARRAWNGEEKS